ncbi:MAG TPA: glycosyltransferase family 39 protein [Caulobacteraceae bacterium]
MTWRSPQVAALAVTVGFVVLRLIGAHYIGLGTDESYSIAVARDLHASYFDHPPMHYWMAHAVEPLFGVSRAGRLPFILLFGGSSWLMFVLTRRLFGEHAGFWATLALNLSGFFTVAAGSWVLPDGPLIFAQLAAAAILAQIWFAEEIKPAYALIGWIAAGICIGLAGLSKYQAALFGFGLGLFLISTARGRQELRRPGPYLAAAIAVIVLSPVILWNADHGWVSFAFQAGRGAPKRLHPDGPLIALVGQMGLLLPWIFAPLVAAAISAGRAGPSVERRWLCLMLGLPAIVIFTLAPLLGAPTLPHWPMPGWLMLFPLLGELLARAAQARTWPRTWAVASLLFVLCVGVLAANDAATGWLGGRFPKAFRRGDPTAETIEWAQLRDTVAQSPILHEPGAFVAALKWNEAGKIDQAVGDLAPVAVLSSDPRQFGYRHSTRDLIGHDALIVGRLDTVTGRMADIAPYFRSLRLLPPIRVGRDGRGEITLGLVEAKGLLKPYDAASRSGH